MTQVALEANADDLVVNDDNIQVLTSPSDLLSVRDELEKAGFTVQHCEYEMYPANSIELNKEDALRIIKLMEVLDDCDDVQNVYCNADFPADVMAETE